MPRWSLLFSLFALSACSGPSNLGAGDDAGGHDASRDSSQGVGPDGGGHFEGGSGEEDGGLACADFAAAKCAKFDSCTQGLYTEEFYGGQAPCKSRETTSCLGILAAPDNTATPDGFEACGKDITSGTCADFFDLTNTPPACTPQSGSRANGRGCVNNGQCQSTWCYAKTGAACGVCSSRPAAGAACVENVDCGGNGMLCSEASTCAMVVAANGSCDTSHPCGFGLSCVGATSTTPGTCKTAGASVGTTCDTTRATAPLCERDFGYFCPSATEECAKASLVDAGQSCGIMPGMVTGADASTPSTLALCGGGAACEPSSSISGTCIAAAADGAECNTSSGPPCLDPARCVASGDGGVDGGSSGTCAILTTTTCN